jgi:transposase InsO family protein
VGDITYIPTWVAFLYLVVVPDAFSRKVVGWATATHLRTELMPAQTVPTINESITKPDTVY